MAYLEREDCSGNQKKPEKKKVKLFKRKWFRLFAVIASIILIVGGVFAWKTGGILNKISGGGLFNSLIHSLPGVNDELKGEKDGRINLVLLGMRGENIPGGGTLADTIMILSIVPKENKISMISVPRDLYIDNPVWGNKTKINAVYAAGEENGKKQGFAEMEKVLSDVTGIPIEYGISINFEGFKQLIDAIGGIEITLDQPFEEAMQFNEPHVCDPNVFTVPTGTFEIKKNKRGKITAQLSALH